MVGPVPVGVNKFNLEANPPDPTLIPSPDLLEVTIVFLTVSYRDREFVRVGYYVYTQYGDEALRDDPPSPPRYELLQRSLLASDPRVTRYTIAWDDAAVGTAVGAGEVPAVGAAGEESAESVGKGLARAFREEAMAAPFKIAGLNDGAGVGVAVAGGVGAGGVQLMED
ncbi:histone chaperone [Zopfochytrium polystomum]|nr:histone chaperone [Zopfochytrium polystomum]